MAVTTGSPRRKRRGVSSPRARGLSPLWARGLNLPWQVSPRCSRLHPGSQNTFKKTRNSIHLEKLVFVLSILNCPQGEDVRWAGTGAACRSCVLVGNEVTSLGAPALGVGRSLKVKNLVSTRHWSGAVAGSRQVLCPPPAGDVLTFVLSGGNYIDGKQREGHYTQDTTQQH